MKKRNSIIAIIFIILLVGPLVYKMYFKESIRMIDISNYSIEEAKEYAVKNGLDIEINKVYSNEEENKIIYQSIKSGALIEKGQTLIIKVSIGRLSASQLRDNRVNELGNIPVMLYQSIIDMKNSETKYTGGNVDINGYARTTEAFRNDLEFYYTENYRIISLVDYINGNIGTELGKSPIVLTFSDGGINNFNVLGIDENNELIIDPNCAVGILEEYKEKYPDYNVTATFFLYNELFEQPEYDELKLNWLIDNGYSVASSTYNHLDLTSLSTNELKKEINNMYKLLDQIIPENYLNIISLPYGKPSTKNDSSFKYILNTGEYTTVSTLRVGWSPDYSPFNKNFDIKYIQRCKAWDNNGKVYDIEMTFKNLNNTRYISDGNKNTIAYPKDQEDDINNIYSLEEIKY